MRLKELVGGIGFALIALSGCKTVELTPVWADKSFSIDGSQAEWTSGMVFVEEQNIAIGVANNAERLYLTLTFSDPRIITRAVLSGFTIWVDGKGGRRERLGVRFPLPNQALGMRPMQRGNRREYLGEFPSEEHLQSLLDAQLNIEMVGPHKEDLYWLPFNNKLGIDLAMAFGADGRLIYELSLPLISTETNRYAPDVSPGDRIGIGLKMSGPQKSSMGRGSRALGGGGGLPGGMGGGRGGRGGRMSYNMGGRAGDRSQFEPLEYWVKVKLATEPKQ